jgi:MFS family permease
MEATPTGTLTTQIPARLDRLPWSGFHWRVVVGLGITWVLDGLEVTILGALSGVLQRPETLGLSAAEIGLSASGYLAGAVLGALFFGYLTDRLGRKKLFTVTLAVYLAGTAMNAFAFDLRSFVACRFITGMGIGGEYAAINSAVDELIPARVRGRTDLVINGSFWLGTIIGALVSLLILDERLFPADLGWRLGFGIGAVLGTVILFLRRFLPESPRWLMTHGRLEEAERIVAGIERSVLATGRIEALPEPTGCLVIHPGRRTGFGAIIRAILKSYRRRSLLAFTLMLAQAFFYNGLFFTYPLVLTNFYGVAAGAVGLYLLPFALSNFLGPAVLGWMFDDFGRKPMIAGTYALAGLLLAAAGYLFAHGLLGLPGQTLLWMLIFFIASSAASSAYLTASEIFPVETRAMAIALFYSLGTGLGGTLAPSFFGRLIDTGSRMDLFQGYLLGAGLMLAAAAMEALIGVKAERKSLEDIAEPLAAEDAWPGQSR